LVFLPKGAILRLIERKGVHRIEHPLTAVETHELNVRLRCLGRSDYISYFSKFIEKAKSLAKKCGKIFIPYAKMRGCGDKLVTLIYRRMLTFSVSVTNPLCYV